MVMQKLCKVVALFILADISICYVNYCLRKAI
jgi:hypothetical protein